jgi:two-component system phosphate regulon sensor histidine kinase PhoR
MAPRPFLVDAVSRALVLHTRFIPFVCAGCGLIGAVTTSFALWRVRRRLHTMPFPQDFLAAVAHELRTPLTSIRHMTELLAFDRVPSEERKHRYYDVLRIEAERVYRLVENLLELRRVYATSDAYRMDSIDLSLLVEAATHDFQKSVMDSGYTVIAEVTARPAMIQGDTDALRRALWNVLDNAVKYSPNQKTVHVVLARGLNDFILSVQDYGIGISKQERRSVFEMFHRGTAAKATGASGTGLGLPMVRRIVQAHNGSIQLDSQPGSGTTVIIRLPIGA